LGLSNYAESIKIKGSRLNKGERAVRKRKIFIYYIIFNVAWMLLIMLLKETSTFSILNFLIHNHLEYVLYMIISCCFIYYLLAKQKHFEDVEKEEHRLSTLINSMADFVNFKDGEGRWIQANDFGLKLFQLEHVDYRGKRDSELAEYTAFYKEALQYCEKSDEETWEAGTVTRCEEVVPLPDGDRKIFDTIKVPVFHEDGSRKALVVIGRDITERKIAQKKLAESEQRYKSLFDYNPNLVYMIDVNGIATNLNPQFEVITGYNPEAFIGKSLLPLIDEESKEPVLETFRKVIQEGTASSGKKIRIIHKDGTVRVLMCTAVPMMIDDEAAGIIGYCQDVTNMMETEEHLRRSEMLSTVGELAAGIAHEIRNPLTALRGFVQLLQRNDLKQAQYYNIMLNELDRINHIVGELLVLAKPQQLVFEKGDVRHILKDVMALLEPQANFYGIEMLLQTSDDVPLIDCEINHLKQLFINLIKNSFEATASKVEVRAEKRDDQYIAIQVQDNGCGIPEERLKHLGEPFFSYKEKGTGLGLTVSYRIAEAHKGKIQFTSKLNEGTTVEVLLPIESHVRS
jgi:PAS domain S-box-containing protein